MLVIRRISFPPAPRGLHQIAETPDPAQEPPDNSLNLPFVMEGNEKEFL
jgi:hypothetical protein